MSYGDKVTYGGSPPKLDANCIDNKEYLADNINELWQQVFIMGGGYVPSAADVDTVPESTPPRRLVRFVLDGTVSSGTATAYAVEPDGSQTQINSPSFTVHDTLDRYDGAGSGKRGWAMVSEYPSGTFFYEIVSLGGEGTVTGTANDELVGVDSGDTAEHLWDKILPANQKSAGYYAANSGSLQAVFFEKAGTSPDDIFAYTSNTITGQTFEVLVSGNDTDESYLYSAFSTASQETTAFDGDDHQRVYVRIDNGSADETLSVYTKRSEDTGKVKCSEADSLSYMNDQFADTGTYDEDRDIKIFRDTTDDPSSNTRLFTSEGKTLLAKLDTSITARVGTTMGASAADISLYTAAGAALSEVLTNQRVYNPARTSLFVYDELYVPVTKVGSSWVLKPTELPQVQDWEPMAELHLVQCSSDVQPRFEGDAPLTDLRVTSNTIDVYNACDGWETKHTGVECP